MYRGIIILFYGLLFLGCIAPIQAARAENFSTITVPIASQSPSDLHQALTDAFIQVLVKISGNVNIGSIKEIKEQLPSVERFVRQYSYVDSTLQVTFDKKALLTLLTEANQPIWPVNRPTALIWLSIDDQPPLTMNSTDASALALSHGAQRRGVPILLPTLETNFDQEVWQAQLKGVPLDQPVLEKIAARYQVPVILLGRITQNADQTWTAEWLMAWQGQTWQWRDQGRQLDERVAAGVDKMADLMASQLAMVMSQQTMNAVWLTVRNVDNLTDYMQVLHELKQLQPVISLVVQDVGSHGILLHVTVTGGGEAALKSALATDPHFIFQPSSSSGGVLEYRWVS